MMIDKSTQSKSLREVYMNNILFITINYDWS